MATLLGGRRGVGRRGGQFDIPTPVRLIGGLAAVVAVGTALLLLPGMSVRPLSVNEAFFTAISALSATGLSIIAPGADLTPMGQAVLGLLCQIGGVGFMAVAVIAFRLIGRRVGLAERLALRDSFGLVNTRAILQLTQRIVLSLVVIELVGAIALWAIWRERLGDARAIGYGVFHAISAFCNAGFDLFGGLPEFPDGMPNDTPTLIVLGVLIVLGSIGFPVLVELSGWWRRRRLSLNTKVTLVVVAILISVGTIGIWLAEARASGYIASEPLHRQLIVSLFQSVSARSAGLTAVPSFGELAPGSQFLLLILMFIGGAAASTGGGITIGAFAVVVVAIWSFARGANDAEVGGRTIPAETVRKAFAVWITSLAVVLTATFLILVTHDGVEVQRVLFEVVSAFGTTGLSLAFTGQLNLFGQILIGFVMFWGRLGALTIVVALARERRPQLVSYPEDQLLIG